MSRLQLPFLCAALLLLGQRPHANAQATSPQTPSTQGSKPATGTAKPAKSKRGADRQDADNQEPPAGKELVAVCSVDSARCVSADPAVAATVVAPFSGALAPAAVPSCYTGRGESNAIGTADALTITTELGQPAPFSIAAQGHTVLIYSSKALTASSRPTLARTEGLFVLLTQAARANSITVQLSVPRAPTLGTAATLQTAAQGIFPGWTVTVIGSDLLSLSSPAPPDCSTFNEQLRTFSRFTHHTSPDTRVASALYLDLASLGQALGATPLPFANGGAFVTGAAASTPSSPPSAAPSGGAGTSAPPAVSAGAAASTTPTATTTTGSAGTGGAGSASPSNTTTLAPASAVPTTAAATPSPAAVATPATPPSAPPFSVNGKDLLFPDPIPGDDAAVTEQKRVLALLDLPQPQVLINAWVVQNSTTKPEKAAEFTNRIHELVDEYNDRLQATIDAGWRAIAVRTALPIFFNPGFYNYVSQRFVFNPSIDLADNTRHIVQGIGVTSVNGTTATFGACAQDRYCLGYQALFRPVKPRLVDLLLTIIAAAQPRAEAIAAINAAEMNPPNEAHYCEDRDTDYLANRSGGSPQRMPLECFRDAVNLLRATVEPTAVGEPGPSGPSQLGAVRAAVADFLFNYKISQQFPHEFTPYDLTQSAQTLDAALAPFIQAFNNDLRAVETHLREEVDKIGKNNDHKAFFNGGILTVRTTSGDAASVNTATQSYLDASTAPTASQLISNILGAQPGGSTNILSGVASNLSFNQAQVIMGALQSYHNTSINIGRQLNLLVRPRSLTGALAAEIDVQLNADDTPSTPTYWTPGPGGGPGTAADLSRVSQYDTTTHVRVDSLRLFEISSLTAVLSKGRDRFPILPPFVELPYIGTLAGIPLRAAKEFHNSSAILSAVVVPTAGDIAYGLRFVSDRVAVGGDELGNCRWPVAPSPLGVQPTGSPCKVRKMQSYADFAGQPVREFHRMKLYCLATEDTAAFATAADLAGATPGFCDRLSFEQVVHEEN